jgi:putative tricarboxylic transport membrane protein
MNYEGMMKNHHIVSGLFWLAIGLGLPVWTWFSYEIGRLTQPGPGYLPFALGVILIGLSLVQLIGQMKRFLDEGKISLTAIRYDGWRKIVSTVIVLMIGAFFFEQVGYLLTFFVLMVLLMRVGGYQGWKIIILTAVLTTACIYVVFVLLLQVQLPRGFLGV